MKYLIILLCLFVLGCTNEKCKSGEFRCNENIEEICADGDWLESSDCSKFLLVDSKIEWVCCDSSDLYDGGPGCDLPQFCK